MSDEIKIEILEDGTISFETDKISGKNHASADKFIEDIDKMMGGKTTKKARRGAHQHVHANGLVHAH